MTAACQASLSFTISWSLRKLMSIESVMSSNYLILCHPLLLPPSIFPSIWVFSNELALHIRWLKYWRFSVSINPCNEYSGFISFSTDWLDLLAVQGTLKSLLQHHSSKASVLRHSAFLETVCGGEELQVPLWNVSREGELQKGGDEEVRCERGQILGTAPPGCRYILRHWLNPARLPRASLILSGTGTQVCLPGSLADYRQNSAPRAIHTHQTWS